jgi:TonB family protein
VARYPAMIFERAVLLLVVSFLLLDLPAAAQDPLAQAQDLYYATYYEEALNLLDRITEDGLAPARVRTVREYRALCLLALDRAPEAEKMLERLIEADPFYQPTQPVAPALLTAVARTRRRVIPALVRETFGQAKIDLENARYAESIPRLELVLRLVSEADGLADDRETANVREIERLASGLLAESRAARDRRAAPAARSIYNETDPGVIAAVPIRQEIPPWRAGKLDDGRLEGALELIVDTNGSVQSARMIVPIHPSYDRALLDAARKWRFRPASKDGRPVAYAHTVTIRVAPLRSSSVPRP